MQDVVEETCIKDHQRKMIIDSLLLLCLGLVAVKLHLKTKEQEKRATEQAAHISNINSDLSRLEIKMRRCVNVDSEIADINDRIELLEKSQKNKKV